MTYLFLATAVAHLLALGSIRNYTASLVLFIAASLLQTFITSQLLLHDAGWHFNAQNACLLVSWLANLIVLIANFKLLWLRAMLHLIAIVVLA